MLLELAYVRKNQEFDNAALFLLLKALFNTF